jgi:dihydrodipicolinate synthase/N-acetylneuraminate lyase
MTLTIRQSELNAVGFTGYFPTLSWNQRKQVAALTLNRVGRTQDAFLLEINNVNAVRGITYVADVPPLRAGR